MWARGAAVKTILRCEGSLQPEWWVRISARSSGDRYAETAMRLHALSVVFGALLFTSGIAHAVDRGQFENVADDVRTWFKGVRSPDGRPCCDVADGHRTIYDVRAGSYWVPIDGVWWRVPERAVVRNAGNPVGEAVVWYVSVRGNIEIRCFVPAE